MTDNPDAQGIDSAALGSKYRGERDKRIKGGRRQLPELTGPRARYVEDPYTALSHRDPCYDRVDVVIVGAGPGGLLIAAKLRGVGVERIRLIDNEDALRRTTVESMAWNQSGSEWVTRTDGGDEIRSQFVILANGPLARIRLPAVPGLSTGFEANEARSSFTRRIGFDVLGKDRASLAAKWSSGLATLHGLTTAKFPNMFVQPAPSSQSTEPVNYLHAMQENAEHMAYIVGEVRRRGARVFEVTEAAEQAWVRTILDRAIDDAVFLAACTPRRRNPDGWPDTRLAANRNFGGGASEFYALLRDWRESGELPGMALRD